MAVCGYKFRALAVILLFMACTPLAMLCYMVTPLRSNGRFLFDWTAPYRVEWRAIHSQRSVPSEPTAIFPTKGILELPQVEGKVFNDNTTSLSTSDLKSPQPQRISSAEPLVIAALNATIYVISAFYDARFLDRYGGKRAKRIIVIAAASGQIKDGWKKEPERTLVRDNWTCLLCSRESWTDGEEGSEGEEPLYVWRVEGRGSDGDDKMKCWRDKAAWRSGSVHDIQRRDHYITQFECKAPEGVATDKITHVTIANAKWTKEKTLDILFGPPTNGRFPKHPLESPPPPHSLHRFKAVERVVYYDEGTQSESRQLPRNPATPAISMCVGPVFDDPSKNIVEWMEFAKMMGNKHVHMYYVDNHVLPLSTEAKRIFHYYAERGEMTLYHWDLPFTHVGSGRAQVRVRKSGLGVWLHAQGAMVMDCYHRAASTGEMVGWMDLDEFLVPDSASHSNWFEALRPIIKNNDISTFVFRNWFFHTDDHPVTHGPNLPGELVTATVFSKSEKPNKPNQRTKCIARIGTLRYQGIHSPRAIVDGHRVVNVPPSLAHIRHYRAKAKTEGKTRVQDFAMLRFQEELYARVRWVNKKLGNITEDTRA